MPDQNTPTVESDTPRGPLTNDREVESILTQFLFPEKSDTNKEVEAAPEPAAEDIAADEEQPEVEAEAAETEETEEVQEEATAADEPPQPRKLRVKISEDAEEEVTEEELVKGYQRQSDYTRKTMQLAEERKRFEAEELRAVREERQKYATYLQQLEEALKPPTVDWEAVKRDNPEGFPALFSEYQLQERNHAIAKAERDKAEAQVQKDRADARVKLLQATADKLIEQVPELKEEPTAKALGKYLTEQGFTPAEIANTDRHELLVMAYKAFRYDEMKAKQPKIEQKVEQKIKPAKPGVPQSTKPKLTEFERDRARLKKTGSVDALADVLNGVFKK
jgi:hypothetical protein